MAQGQYYTRQQLNTLAQRRLAAKQRAAEEKKIYYNPTTGERQAVRPSNPYLEEMKRFQEEAKAAGAYKYQGGSDYYKGVKLGKYNVTNDSLPVVKKYKAYEKAIDRQQDFKTAYADQKDYYKRKAQRDNAIKARNEGVTTDQRQQLIKKFGSDVYNEMSPEARDYAYAQLQGRTTPTPNTAKAKDDYNRAQERYVQKIRGINQQSQEIYDDINANWSTATAGEYFSYVKTGVDPRAKPPKRDDYKSSLAYNYALREYNNTPRATLTGNTPQPSKARELGYAFTAGITGDVATADAMRLDARNPGAANLAYGAGLVSYIPARYYALKGTGQLIGGVTGAGASLGGKVGTTVLGVGGRYASAGAVGGSIGTFAGGVAFAAPPVLLATYGATEFQSIPVNRELERRNIDRGEFRAAYSQALSDTGGLAELSPLFANQERFNANLSASLARRGLTPSQALVGLGNQQRVASGTGDALGLVFAGAAANVLGAQLLTRTGVGTLYRTPIGTFSGGGFRAIGAAGILEGGVSSYGQNVARFEALDSRRAAIGAGFGGVSAGLLGGFVAGTAAAGQRSASSFYEGVGFVADPSEFGSDVLTASNPYGNARITNVFAVNAPPLSAFQGGAKELQPTLTEDFGIPRPAPAPKPQGRGSRPRGVSPFVNSQPFTNTQPQPLVDIPVQPEPNPVVPVSSNPYVPTNPFVPVAPNPFVPAQPAPNVPVSPNPVVPSQPNPIVDVPVTKLFIPGLGRGSTIPRRGRQGFGSGFRKATYTPSFAALELGIGASSINTNRTFSGFEIRPFLSPGSKKKKKGKPTRRTKRRARAPLFSLRGAVPI